MNTKAKAKAQFIIAGIALVFSVFALFTINKNNGLAWFSSNDKATANGLAVQVKCDETILGPNNYVTTFVVSVATSGSEVLVSYSRESMTVHANASPSSSSLTVTKHEHEVVLPPTQQNE